jgi:hypothetical protein
MLKLEEIQSTVCSIVTDAPVLANFPFPQNDSIDAHVFADDGTVREQIEDSMKAIGWAIVVSPPVGASVKDQVAATASSAGGAGFYTVLTNVAVRTFPKKNTGINAIVPLVAVKQIIQAALNWKPSPQEKGFVANHELPFSPDFMDEGCYTYDIKLLKTVSLA